MAIHFGDNISDDFLTENTIPQYVGYGKGPHRVRTAPFHVTVPTNTTLTADAIIIGRIRSGDRIGGLWLSAPAFPTATTAPTVNIGLYESKLNGGYSAGLGTAIDSDVFATAVSLTSAQDRTNVFSEAAGALFGVHRWKTAWEIVVASGAQSYTADPRQTWDLVLGVANTPTATASAFEILVSVDLISGS